MNLCSNFNWNLRVIYILQSNHDSSIINVLFQCGRNYIYFRNWFTSIYEIDFERSFYHINIIWFYLQNGKVLRCVFFIFLSSINTERNKFLFKLHVCKGQLLQQLFTIHDWLDNFSKGTYCVIRMANFIFFHIL